VRTVSSNLVPDPHFHRCYPGMLLSDSCLPPYQRPYCVVWLVDEQLSSRREQDVSLPPLAHATPALPFWLFTSPGDNECCTRSMLLTHAATGDDDDFKINDIVRGMPVLERNPITGGVAPGSSTAAAELQMLADYRVRSVACTALHAHIAPVACRSDVSPCVCVCVQLVQLAPQAQWEPERRSCC
jgi:hypothetical protein